MSPLSSTPRPRGGKWPTRLAWLAVILLVIAAALMGGAGPAYRLEWLSLGESFSLLRRGAQLAPEPRPPQGAWSIAGLIESAVSPVPAECA